MLTSAPGHANSPASPPQHYQLPAGDAVTTLRLFTRQSGEQIVYLLDQVRGHRTRAVHGTFLPAEALRVMLEDTGLTVRRDGASGALTVVRERTETSAPPQAEPGAARSRRPEWAEDVIELSDFTVSTHAVDRYRAANAISAVRLRAPLVDTPSSISVITRDAIDDVAPTRLFDITRYIAGIADGRGVNFSDRQIIRGFESNGRTIDNFIQVGADNYDEALVERIEVSKGPNAILAPAGVPGGSINVITKSPSFAPRRQVTALVGRFDAQKLTLDVTGPIDDRHVAAYRLVASYQDTARYWSADARLRMKAIAPMLTYRFSDRTVLTLKLIGTDYWSFREPALIIDSGVTRQTKRPYLAPGFSTRSRNRIQPWSHVGTQIADAYGLLTSTVNETLSLRVAANARYYLERSTQQFLSTPSLVDRYNPATGELTPDHVWSPSGAAGAYVATYQPLFDRRAIPVRGDKQRTTIRSYAVQADAVVTHHPADFTAQTIVGWAAGHSNQIGRLRRGALPPLDLDAPEPRVQPVWEPALYAHPRTLNDHWQIYLNHRLGLLDERVLLSGGFMRYGVEARYAESVAPARGNTLDSWRDRWLGSMLVKPRENVSLYYSYSTNSAPNVVNEQPIWRDGQQHEIGVKTEWFSQRLSLNMAWFDITQTNLSVPNPERQTNVNAPEHLLANLGNHGVEIELVGGLTRNLSIMAAHTELHMRDRLGRRVRAVADRNSGVLLNYRVPLGAHPPLALQLGLTYAGSKAGDTTPVDFTPLGVVTQPSFIIPASTSVNLGASYRWQHTLFRLHVDNLFDEAGHLQQAGGRVSGTGLSTATGRNVKVSATVTF